MANVLFQIIHFLSFGTVPRVIYTGEQVFHEISAEQDQISDEEIAERSISCGQIGKNNIY